MAKSTITTPPTPQVSTIEQLARDAAARRAEAVESYRTLLLRNDAPEPGDAASLQEAAAVLGRGPEWFADDLALFQRLVECEETAAEEPKRRARRDAAKQKQAATVAEYDVRQRELDAERASAIKVADVDYNARLAEWRLADQAATELKTLALRFRSLAEGVPFEALAAQAKSRVPAPKAVRSRDTIIAGWKRQVVDLRMRPVVTTGSSGMPEAILKHVNRELETNGHGPLLAHEIESHGLANWTSET